MASLNKVMLMGNLTRDPQIRHTPKGIAVGDLGLAINQSFRMADGTDKEETVYVDVVVWGRQAETCSQFLTKGSPVFVEGRLQLDQWTSNEGEKKSKMRVRADRVQFLGRPSGSGGGGQGGGGGYQRSGDGGRAPAGGPPMDEEMPPLPEDDSDIPF